MGSSLSQAAIKSVPELSCFFSPLLFGIGLFVRGLNCVWRRGYILQAVSHQGCVCVCVCVCVRWTDSAFLLQVCDSDTVLDPACTIEMLRVLEEDPQVGGVGGDVQVRSNQGFLRVEGLDSASSSNWIYWGSVHFVLEGGFLFDSFIGIEGLICYPPSFLFYFHWREGGQKITGMRRACAAGRGTVF